MVGGGRSQQSDLTQVRVDRQDEQLYDPLVCVVGVSGSAGGDDGRRCDLWGSVIDDRWDSVIDDLP